MRPDPIPIMPAKTADRAYFGRATGREFSAHNSDGATEISIFDEIGGYGVTATGLEKKLAGAGDVVLKINSPGGDIFEGLAAYNLLLAHPGKIRVEIVGIAASAASLIAMAGDEIAIAENAFLMIHRAWAATIGNEADHGETAAVLRQLDKAMVATYAKRTGQQVARIKAMVDAESWLGADAAIAAGFATEKLQPVNARARFDLSVYSAAPAELSAELDRSSATIRDVEAALRDAGWSRSQAAALAARGYHGNSDDQRDAAAIAKFTAHIGQLFN